MKIALCATYFFYTFFQTTVFGYSHHVTRTIVGRSLQRETKLALSQPPESANSAESTEDEDEDFAAMQREIELMIASSTSSENPLEPAANVSEIQDGKYNKVIAVASAILGSFLFVFQHSQPVSGVALMHAMERDSVGINVRQFYNPTFFLFSQASSSLLIVCSIINLHSLRTLSTFFGLV